MVPWVVLEPKPIEPAKSIRQQRSLLHLATVLAVRQSPVPKRTADAKLDLKRSIKYEVKIRENTEEEWTKLEQIMSSRLPTS